MGRNRRMRRNMRMGWRRWTFPKEGKFVRKGSLFQHTLSPRISIKYLFKKQQKIKTKIRKERKGKNHKSAIK
jgi:hypothetical protein